MSTTSLHGVYAVNRPTVVSELIDGETLMMHLGTGHYFSARGTASRIWTLLEAGLPAAAIADRLAREFTGERRDIEASVAAFLATLVEHGLVVAADDGQRGAQQPPPTPTPATTPGADGTPREPFAAPALEVYADMQDLLFLDPIHDVDEAGWPSAAVPEQHAGRGA